MQLDRLNIAQPQPATMLLQAMGMKDQMRRTDIAADRNTLARERMLQDQEEFEFRKKQAIFAQSRDFIPDLKREDFPKYKSWLNGIFPELAELLPENVDDLSPKQWEAMKQKITIGTDNMAAQDRETFKAIVAQSKSEREQQNKIELKRQEAQAKMELEKYKQEQQNKRQKSKQAHEKEIKGENVDSDYNASLTNAYAAIEKGADLPSVFSELRKTFPSKSKDLITIEKGIKALSELPEDLQQALEVNAIAINNGELEADEVIRKLGSQWPDYAVVIKRVLSQKNKPEDLAEALRIIFE
jgi:hypothetical protein